MAQQIKKAITFTLTAMIMKKWFYHVAQQTLNTAYTITSIRFVRP